MQPTSMARLSASRSLPAACAPAHGACGTWGLRDVGPDDHGEDSLEVAVAALGPQVTRDILEIFALAEEMGDEAPMENVSRFHGQDPDSFWPVFAIAESLDLDDVPLPKEEDSLSPE